MKAHIPKQQSPTDSIGITYRQKEAIKQQIAKLNDDTSKRCQYLWMAAMLNAGLSVRTIKRVRKELDDVYERYDFWHREDQCADEALVYDLRNKGLDVDDDFNWTL